MDLAYDHIQEDAYPKDQPSKSTTNTNEGPTLTKDVQEAYKAFSNSPWGARLGGFFGNVVKQGGEVYTQAQKELAEVGEDAQKGLSGLRETLISRTRGLSITTGAAPAESSKVAEDGQSTPTQARSGESSGNAAGDSGDVLARLRSEAAKRLKDLQRAEDAADEALLKFGGNVRNFLRDAISIAPPQQGAEQGSSVLFESKDAQGKRVIHTSRFDAQLHVIHTSTESFAKDPSGPEFEKWAKEFDADKKTLDINSDLQKYPDLRATMEKLVPTTVPYADFWKRYYFLRHGIETAEARRRDLLKAASTQDEVGWGDDDSDEDDSDDETTTPAKNASPNTKATVPDAKATAPDAKATTPIAKTTAPVAKATTPVPKAVTPATKAITPAKAESSSAASSTTIHPPAKDSLKPVEPRKSNDEKSQADSEASYDVVGAASGKTSQAPSSPKDSKNDEESESDDSDEDEEDEEEDSDWE